MCLGCFWGSLKRCFPRSKKSSKGLDGHQAHRLRDRHGHRGVSKGIGWIADKLGVGSGDKTGNNATGTQSWRGGMTWVGEHGPELMALPKGTRILSNPQSKRQVRRRDDDKPQPQGGKGGVVIHINIPKLADQIIVREEADIDRIGEAVTKRVVLAVRNSIA